MLKQATPLITTPVGNILYYSPILGHTGHDHNRNNTENQQNNSKDINGKSDSKTTETNETETTIQTVEEPSTNQTEMVTIGQLPAFGETILILMVASPLLLYSLKQRIHS